MFPEGFCAVGRRSVNIAHGNRLAGTSHVYLLIVLQVQLQFRVGIDRNHGIIMRFRQAGKVQDGVRTVRIRPGIQVDIVGALQFPVYFHAIVAGDPVIRNGGRRSSRAADICLCRHVHLDFVAAAEGYVAAVFIFAGLFQLGVLAYGHLICGCDKAVAVHKQVFSQAAALAFHLVDDVHIGIGVIYLAFLGSHAGIFANGHIGFAVDHLAGLYIR